MNTEQTSKNVFTYSWIGSWVGSNTDIFMLIYFADGLGFKAAL